MIRQGDVYWVDLGTPHGSGPGYLHPHAVIQNDVFNHSRINTIDIQRKRLAGSLFDGFGEYPGMLNFAGAVHCRMAGKNLLNQAGAGPWHPHNEDRRVIGNRLIPAFIDEGLADASLVSIEECSL